MAWTKKTKPNTSNWQMVNRDPNTSTGGQFDINIFDNATFDTTTQVIADLWVKKAKPSTSSWTKVSKP
ncbi:MAG: hypothetical protein KGJ90_04750 [Patescibacteria group bacterium]|nr:hypothetical protein [Patescibacteria group bacterium]